MPLYWKQFEDYHQVTVDAFVATQVASAETVALSNGTQLGRCL